MKERATIDLSLLKKLVVELENTLATTEVSFNKNDLQQYVVEASKAVGLASGVMAEASALIGDIAVLVKQNTSVQSLASDPLEALLNPIKGKVTPHGNN